MAKKRKMNENIESGKDKIFYSSFVAGASNSLTSRKGVHQVKRGPLRGLKLKALLPTKGTRAIKLSALAVGLYGYGQVHKGFKEEGKKGIFAGLGTSAASDIGGILLGGAVGGLSLRGLTKLGRKMKAARAVKKTRVVRKTTRRGASVKDVTPGRGNVVFRRIRGVLIPMRRKK